MSYCRWSSDDWSSDVYVYEDVSGGWTTHVAGRRRVLPDLPPRVELPHPFTDEQFKAWYARLNQVNEMVSAAELVDIGLPHDGETFNDPTPGECADRLAALREVGYHVPKGVVEDLRAEQDEMTAEHPAGAL